MSLIEILSGLLDFILNLGLDSNPNTEQAVISPLAIGIGLSAVQTGMGLWQSQKANKMKADDSGEKAAMAKIEANQKQLIGRAKMREAIGGEMPGQSALESKIGASTAQSVQKFQEMGNQAGYQDFLNQALQREQETLATLGVESAKYKLDRSLAVDEAVGGMQNVYGMQYQSAMDKRKAREQEIAAAKGVAASNITGGLTSAASMGMMAAGSGGGKKSSAPGRGYMGNGEVYAGA